MYLHMYSCMYDAGRFSVSTSTQLLLYLYSYVCLTCIQPVENISQNQIQTETDEDQTGNELFWMASIMYALGKLSTSRRLP